jgi:predicted ATPase
VLTRLEVDGFKNLFGLEVDFGPYTCIAGPNAVGKSNVFDVIEFMALIADLPFMEAAQRLRSAGDRPGDPRTLFWYDGTNSPAPMRIAAEMIVPNVVTDDFGQEASPSSTFLRYELQLAYVEPSPDTNARYGNIRLIREDLNYIPQSSAAARLGWTKGYPKFRSELVTNRRRSTGYISTQEGPAGVVFQTHQDGGSRGLPRRSPLAPRTVVSSTNTVDDPTILAARREMQQWRKLALEPTAMRAPDSAVGPSEIGPNGSHLAAALYRLAFTGTVQDDVFARVAATASALTDIRGVGVDFDSSRDLFTLEAQLGVGPFLPARALSDGTLRFLALSIIEADSEFGGLICMEEPENGIHPAKIGEMVTLLRSLSVDPAEPPGTDNPVRQVVVNTHSPRFVWSQEKEDLLLALPRSVMRAGQEVRTLDLLPMTGTWRRSNQGYAASKALIGDYLTKPPEALMELDYPDRQMESLD